MQACHVLQFFMRLGFCTFGLAPHHAIYNVLDMAVGFSLFLGSLWSHICPLEQANRNITGGIHGIGGLEDVHMHMRFVELVGMQGPAKKMVCLFKLQKFLHAANNTTASLSADILNGATMGTSRLSDVTTLAIGYMFIFSLVIFYLGIASTAVSRDDSIPLQVSDPFTEIPADMLLFQFCILFAIEHFKLRTSIKSLLRYWFTAVGWALGLTDFLLPRPYENGGQDNGNDDPCFVLRIFLLLLGCLSFSLYCFLVKWFNVWFTNLHNSIHDDRYLIGCRLHNFVGEDVVEEQIEAETSNIEGSGIIQRDGD
ncbi:hypothetical protein Ddye_003620 [Dipteronia dyeriana]|uniref:RING-type E3 ubiquitin transferase n=1 Tax=Dipteronia dyeriana TaxID=168575 RepID=A0AAD9XT80_9ROSI|nr:hypothetical protein Ddye_003620 [Dipteronia dyeriana]